MPKQNMTPESIKQVIAYFRWADANVRPQGDEPPPPAKRAPVKGTK